MTNSTYEKVECYKTDALMTGLIRTTQGPAEAYAILITCIHELNFKYAEVPVTIDELCEEVCHSLRSVTEVRKSQ